MYGELTHQTAQAQRKLSLHFTVNIPLLACRRQCHRRLLSIAPNFRAERSSPQTAGNQNISNNTILNTFKLHARRIWPFAARPDVLNQLSVMKVMLTKILSKTWMWFHKLKMLKWSQTWNLNNRHLLCCRWKYTPAPALSLALTLLGHGRAMLRVTLRRTYRSIPTTHLRHVKITNIFSVCWRRRVWRRTITMYGRMKIPLWVSDASITGMASRSSWPACHMIRLSARKNYTLLRIWDRKIITNELSNAGE